MEAVIYFLNEVDRFENEIVIFEIVFWNGPWTTIRRIPKCPPYTSSGLLKILHIPPVQIKPSHLYTIAKL
jgi:hypothetical protein